MVALPPSRVPSFPRTVQCVSDQKIVLKVFGIPIHMLHQSLQLWVDDAQSRSATTTAVQRNLEGIDPEHCAAPCP